jgi:hypothetical protein
MASIQRASAKATMNARRRELSGRAFDMEAERVGIYVACLLLLLAREREVRNVCRRRA